MAVEGLRRRLDKIEGQTRSGVIVIWRHHTETDAAAVDRWKKENPGRDPDAAGLRVMLVRWADQT